MNEKRSECSKCFRVSPLTPGNISKLTGERLYRSWCLDCEKERKDIWRQQNKQRHNKKGLAWVKNNPEKAKTIRQKCATKNKEKLRAYHRQHRLQNQEVYRTYVAVRRKRVQQATPPWQTLSELREWYLKAQELKKVTGKDYHVDHIVPLNGKQVCGLHVPWNLQLLESTENLKKSNMLYEGVA